MPNPEASGQGTARRQAEWRILTQPPLAMVFEAAMSYSPWERVRNGDEDVTTPFNAGTVSRCFRNRATLRHARNPTLRQPRNQSLPGDDLGRIANHLPRHRVERDRVSPFEHRLRGQEPQAVLHPSETLPLRRQPSSGTGKQSTSQLHLRACFPNQSRRRPGGHQPLSQHASMPPTLAQGPHHPGPQAFAKVIHPLRVFLQTPPRVHAPQPPLQISDRLCRSRQERSHPARHPHRQLPDPLAAGDIPRREDLGGGTRRLPQPALWADAR